MKVIFCEDCCTLKLASDFDNEMHKAWKNMDTTVTVSCKVCTGERSSRHRNPVDRTVRFACSGPGS